MALRQDQLRYVFFDLETSGFYHSKPDILQIAAVTFDGRDSFDSYFQPTKPIEKKASQVNNLYLDRGCLFRKVTDGVVNSDVIIYRMCYTLPPKQGLEQFLNWLKDEVGGNVVLVAYNGLQFDARILLRKMSEFRLNKKYDDVIVGFIDPLEPAKQLYPHLESKSMSSMMTHLNIQRETGQTHNALMDSVDLRELTIAMFKNITSSRGDTSWSSFFMHYFKHRDEIAAKI